MKRRTWTIEPAGDVESIVKKEMTKRVGVRGRKHGLRTRIIEDAIRGYYARHIGKREDAQAA